MSRLERIAKEIAEGDLDRLPDLADEVGSSEERIRRAVESGQLASSTVQGRVVVLELPRALVERWLPDGLELAPQPISMPDRHPVVLIFAHERGQWLEHEVDAREATLGIPWVQLANPHVPLRGPFLYAPRRHVDGELPRRCGARLLGWSTRPARIHADDDAVTVRDGEGSTLAHARFETAARPVEAEQQAGLWRMRAIFEQPVVSQAMAIAHEDASQRRPGGPLVAVIDRLRLEAPGTVITPLRAQVELRSGFAPEGTPPARFDVGALGPDGVGAFSVLTQREVSVPVRCDQARFVEAPLPLEQRPKVVVLGGGPSACAAAFYLAKTQRYRVTMYTLGFRLGGKCAAGRNLERARRIEEHGPHVFIGFYNNVFRTLREVAEVAKVPLSRGGPRWTETDLACGEGPFARAADGTSEVGVMARWPVNERWHYVPTTIGVNELVPGEVPHDPQSGPQGFARALRIILQRALTSQRELREWDEARREAQKAEEEPSLLDRITAHFAPSDEERPLLALLEKLVDDLEQRALDEVVEAIRESSRAIRFSTKILRKLRSFAREHYADSILTEPDKWAEWSSLDTFLTVVIGILADRLVELSAADDEDFKAWLVRHGIAKDNDCGPTVHAIYDLLYTNEADAPVRPGSLAAGVALRWFLLLNDFRGFQAYVLQRACPETMFSPYYRALKKLGVEIRFFHRVEALKVERRGGERVLTGIRLHQQATVKGGPGAYEPLWLPPESNDERGFEPWPNRPDYEQLEEGTRLAEHDLEDAWTRWPGAGPVELSLGEDFDACVCGLSLGALPPVVQDLIDPRRPCFSEPWAEMIERTDLCQTLSMQLWIQRPCDDLYAPPCRRGVPRRRGLLACYEPPMPSVLDFSKLIGREGWAQHPEISPPRYLAYHTGALEGGQPLRGISFDDHEFPARTRAEFIARAATWLSDHYRALFDRAPESFDELCELLVAPAELRGPARLEWQHFNIGVQPWDLYVLARPGTPALRLGQSESWVRGLFLCGDWTATDMSSGCVEAATQSGMLCARAISSHPRYVWRVGF